MAATVTGKTEVAGYAAVIWCPGLATRFYGHGCDKPKTMMAVRKQIAGATPTMRRRILDRITLHECDAAQMSEIEEMLAAEVLEWL